MGFLSPWFLAGAAAVGLPIWLHLLKRHKTDPRPFPSLMFFEKREQSSVVHRRLDYIVLFILRTLMLVVLALLFANPFIRRATPASLGKKIVVVAVDHSFSMRTVMGGRTRLDAAKSEAEDVLSKVPPGTPAEVVALGGHVQAMTQQSTDPGELRGAVAAIQPTDGRASFGELARFLRALQESTHTPLEVHLVSDMQKSALPPGFTDLRLGDDTTLILHPVGMQVPNWTVENVVAPSRVYDPKRVRIQATITGFDAPAAQRTASLVLNGKTVQTKTVEVPANGRAQVEFLNLDASYGFNRCEVRIDSADALPADDQFPFSVERTDPKKILFVDDGRHASAALYFRDALDASADAAFTLSVQRPEVAMNGPLTSYAVVVLNEPGTLPSALLTSLNRYVNAGGSVMIALGPASAVLPSVPLTGDAITGTDYASRETERFFSVADTDSGHPVLQNVGHFEGVSFYQVVAVTPSKSHVLARLNDNAPLLLERQIGEGKVLVFTSTFDKSVNDLPIHAAYWVPFIQQSALYLGGGGAEQPVNQTVDSYVELRTGQSKDAAAEVLDPDGKRVLTLQEATTAKTYPLTREGFFQVKAANGQRRLVAVHADRRESDLQVASKDTLDLWKATGTGAASGAGSGGAKAEDTRKPWSLSPILLLLLLGIALAESVVADRYLRPTADRQEGARAA